MGRARRKRNHEQLVLRSRDPERRRPPVQCSFSAPRNRQQAQLRLHVLGEGKRSEGFPSVGQVGRHVLERRRAAQPALSHEHVRGRHRHGRRVTWRLAGEGGSVAGRRGAREHHERIRLFRTVRRRACAFHGEVGGLHDACYGVHRQLRGDERHGLLAGPCEEGRRDARLQLAAGRRVP